ncbi:MAG: hypothetical protein RML40_12165, partial [Bacteroidota bacterium]|nr:hypothetical protein [Candidatus Kapabacteria bacterium]MDW8221270.1 hypothetical protein [Bacteroidota bacterium]
MSITWAHNYTVQCICNGRVHGYYALLIPLILFWNVVYSQSSFPQHGLRCSDAITICEPVFITNFSTDSTWLLEALPNLGCLSAVRTTGLSNRVNGAWYRIIVYQRGDLGFGIQPLTRNKTLDATVNLDWVLFRVTDTTGCGRLAEPIRCNFAQQGGLTGAIDSEQPSAQYEEPIRNVNIGDTFLLLVLNPDNHPFGYMIDMGFSS